MHAHGADQHLADSAVSERRLTIVLALSIAYLIAEVVGGRITGSLALLADASHMLGDGLGLSMAIAAVRFARRPATAGKTYGFYRAEILAAMVNGLVMLVACAWILESALARVNHPEPIDPIPMALVGGGGIGVTWLGLWLLRGHATDSLNVRGASLEILGDLFGSVGTVVAALIVLTTGWVLADPLISALIGILMVPRALGLLRTVVDVLLEATPRHLSTSQIEAAMCRVPGVASVHDLHIWSISSGFEAMSGHVLTNGRSSADVLHDLRSVLHDRYAIDHLTLQVEAADHADDGACCIVDPRCFVPPRAAGRFVTAADPPPATHLN